ncbi:MAG: hypothetical protein QXG98_01830 [Candidatus Micrarchaeia archaeon]
MTWETSAADVYKTFGGYGWLEVAMLALLTAFLSVALAYMLAIGFNLPNLRRWAKAEFYQAAASAMLVALVFTFVEGTDLLTGESLKYSAGIQLLQKNTELFAGDIVAPGQRGRVRPFNVVYAHVTNMINCAREKYLNALGETQWREWLTQIVITLSIYKIDLVIPFQLLLWPLYTNIVENHVLANSLVWTLMALYFQQSFLQWVETSMLTVFFPLGIILRILPITRGAGAVLIAISLGLYIVYPLLFILIATAVTPPSGCARTEITLEQPPEICVSDPSSFVQFLKAAAQSRGTLYSGQEASMMAQLTMYAFFYPLVMILIVVIFVRTASSFLGAEITEVGRGLFRLI